MTESEWLTGISPKPMLEFLKGKVSDRKMRLFGVACCRKSFNGQQDSELRHSVVLMEREADKLIPAEEVITELSSRRRLAWAIRLRSAYYAAFQVARMLAQDAPSEAQQRVRTLHDIFGNPFRPVTVAPSWVTSTVRILAEGIYEERAFDRMPILADALQDAGCENEDILNHCRQPGEHAKGCWVIDLLFGKG